MKRSCARAKQAGLTLIELMVGLTLGLMVIGTMVLLFVNSKESYRMNENLARLQENGRFAMNLISRDLRWADYRACLAQDLLPNAIAGVEGNGSPDGVTIVYQSNECDAAPSTFTTVYTLQAGASGAPSLFRSVNGGAAQELVEDIADVQLLYGEDTNDDDVPNYYVDWDEVTDPADVISVRLTVTARTPEVSRAAGGGRVERDFTSTVVLRNRLP